jgi:DNA repair protein RecN (Recombination protein N)
MSLGRIHLRDFVIVKELEIEFSKGFTVLTGETGAGKSILIDALQIALGARSETGFVREGATKAEVCVEFTPNALLKEWLIESGFDEGDEWLIKRVIEPQGKSKAWLNGSPITTGQLKSIGEQLLDIHGQHAWQSLTKADAVRGLLDAYAGVDTGALKASWDAWRSSLASLKDAQEAQSTRQEAHERLVWQISELEKLSPGADEWQELNAQHQRLSNAQSLLESAQNALQALQNDENGALSQLFQAQQTLNSHAHIEPEFAQLGDILGGAWAQAQDAAHSINSWLKNVDLDPQGLAELDARLSLWMGLARRFKKSPEELFETLEEWRSQLAELSESLDLEQLQKKCKLDEAHYLKEAQAVSTARAKAAPALAKAITQAMQGLGMQGGVFDVELQSLPQESRHGLEDVAFLVAAHPGSTPKPVSKVASGGELSRIALAIAVTTSQLGSTETLIFDEVDSGVGGAVAHTVGRLLQQLGADRQVLAVTHLPQVAACADQHWVVSKTRDMNSTWSSVHLVSGLEREVEVSRMLGGEANSEASMAHAKEMLKHPKIVSSSDQSPMGKPHKSPSKVKKP